MTDKSDVRICMIVYSYYHRDPRVRRYCEALASSGAHVDVISLRSRGELRPQGDQNGVGVYMIPLSRSRGGRLAQFIKYGIAFILFTIWLLVLHARHRYHVIHIHNMPDFLVFSGVITRLLGAKVILDIHDPMPELYMSKYGIESDSLLLRLVKLQERISTRFADAIITANANFKERLIQRGVRKKKIVVVNNLPDPAIFDREQYPTNGRNVADGSEFVLIYPGTIAPRYGIDIAIRALPLIIEEVPNIRLNIIVSRAIYADYVQEVAEDVGVSNCVDVTLPVPIEEIPARLAQANAGIYTGLSDPHMEIATPTKVLEYAMMGIPIISSKLKVLERFFDDDAILFFEPGNVEQFAECVIELHDDQVYREKLVENADACFVQVYSWEEECKKYFGLLGELLPDSEDETASGKPTLSSG
jgi:glycosyltransferase involved in cell wall biosynthesis